MRKATFATLIFILLIAGCAPAPAITQEPATATVAAQPSAVLADPPACSGADLLYDAALKTIIMTRCAPEPSSSELPNVIWAWDGAHWSKIAEGGPDLRVVGGAAYDAKRNVVVQYGGQPLTSAECTPETWEWDGATWVEKEVESPTACDHFKMIYDASRGEVILFGGQDASMAPQSETWAWDGATWKSISSTGPDSRAHFGFVYDTTHGQALLYGGYTGSMKDDFWAWKDGAWTEIDFKGPGTLSHFGMASDTTENALILFGGATSSSTYNSLGDATWKLIDGAWQELHPDQAPSKRGLPAMAYDPERKKIVLYGGFDSSGMGLADTWEWDGTSWQCVAGCDQ